MINYFALLIILIFQLVYIKENGLVFMADID